jgi:NADPH-dependent 2,4-dienoyl-CoA reductase/sulfur reductase-like enzyme
MSDGFELLVVGGGPAGLSAARAYRAAGGGGAVAIVTDEHRMPYNRPPLTKELLRGDSSEDELPIEPEAWLTEHDVRLLGGRAVTLDAGVAPRSELAGRTAAGADARWDAVPGFWSTIGDHTLKYAAWGDSFEDSRLEQHGDDAFTAWYGRSGKVVGVLAHEADEDYERGRSLIAQGAPWH